MPIFFDEFNALGLDSSKWYMSLKQWGAGNNGIVLENISFDQLHLNLAVHGDEYDGIIPGCRKSGMRYPRVEPNGKPVSGKRVGAGIATKAYYASGRYEFRMRALALPGTWLAAGTYHYVEVDTETETIALTDDVNIQVMFENDAFSGLLSTYANSKVTTQKVPLPSVSAPARFHTYRFDWHTEDPHPPAGKSPRRVDYYVDNTLISSVETTIPSKAGRFMIATLCPVEAGRAPFNAGLVKIDWVRITPFNEAGDVYEPESYPVDGLVQQFIVGGR